MKKAAAITIYSILLAFCLMLSGCGVGSSSSAASGEIHVAQSGSDTAGDGSEGRPFATVQKAVSRIEPGSEVIIHSGEYPPFELDENASGTEDAPVTISAAPGETAVIKADGPARKKADDPAGTEESFGIMMENVSFITIRGLEVDGGTHGIAYYGTDPDPARSPARRDISIEGCTVHGIRGVHGICVYGEDPHTAVKDIRITGNEVYDCECGSSETIAVNGNIDGFEIDGNVIHDNNNIGIDMIGFEGIAKADSHDKDPFASDFVRNGKCHGNIVYNISSEGNDAYLEDGEYDLCADGIYVDGGQDIEIYENYIYNCDIGIEVATEHSPKDSDLFKVSGIEVHDNVIHGCKGWCGLAIGGYDKDLGFTEGCGFTNNTFIENGTQIGIQRSRDNVIENNLFVGGDASIEFNGDCREKDMANDFGENTWVIDGSTFEETCDLAGYDPAVLFPDDGLKKQIINDDKESVIDGMRSLVKGTGSSFVPDASAIKRADRD